MKKSTGCSAKFAVMALALMSMLVVGCAPAGPPQASAPPQVSFRSDVAPILAKHCTSCHVEGQPGTAASGLQLDGYAAVMKGTRFGAVVIPRDPLSSTINVLVEGRADPRIAMPHGGKGILTAAEIKTLHDWVQQGALDN